MAKKRRAPHPPAKPTLRPAAPPEPVDSPSAPTGYGAAAWAAAACALVYFLLLGGSHAVVPTHIDWLMRADWSQHYLGWAFFRRAPWQWPLGTVGALGHPVGTTVALTDGNPLLALALRPIAPWLPEPFQYIGPFMAACMALQGYFGARLAQVLGAHARAAFLCGLLFVLTPALLHRMDHDTLMGHWLILASIMLCLRRPKAKHRRRFLLAVWGTATLAALIHPYLLAMALPLLSIAVAQHAGERGLLSRAQALGCAAAVAGTLALVAWALGYFAGHTSWGTDGFGFFCADTTAFFNPRGWSRLLPDLPASRGQAYEGFGYLGLGIMGLGVLGAQAAVRHRLRPRRRKTAWALVAVAVLATLFAWGSHLHVRGQVVLDISRLYHPIEPLCAMFRASGRFVWLPTYLMMAAAVWALCAQAERAPKNGSHRRLDLCLAALVVLQLIDVRPLGVTQRLTQDPKVAMADPLWQAAAGDYDHVVLVPPNFPTSHVSCNPKGYPEKIEMPPGLLAASLGMTVNSAYLSRSDPQAIVQYCNALSDTLSAGSTDGRSIYLVHPEFLPWLHSTGAPMVCFKADSYIGCVRRDRPTRLVRDIVAHGRQLP